MIINLPIDLNLDEHIKKYSTSKIENFSKGKLAFMLSLLISVPAHNKDIAKNDDGWVPLSSVELAKIAKNYTQYLDYASGLHCLSLDDDARLIEIDKTYSTVDHKSRQYRFREKYRLNTSLTEVISNDKVLNRRIEKERRQQWNQTKKLYPNLVLWFNRDLQIDGAEARAYIQQLMKQEEATGKSTKSMRYLAMLQNVVSIENGRFHMKVDGNIQRLHTNLTNMKSELRHFLTYKGQPLVSVDITSSQPYLSLVLFNPAFYQGHVDTQLSNAKRNTRKFNISTVAPRVFQELSGTKASKISKNIVEKAQGKIKQPSTSSSQLSSLIMFSKYVYTADLQDVAKYELEMSKGSFYEYLAYKFIRKTAHIYVYRKEIKAVVFTVLFTGNNFLGQEGGELKQEFKRVFPNVYELFKLLKKGDKGRLARLLQSVESWLILDKISTRISRERSDLPIFTIHDSILTTRGNEGYVRNVMEEELERYIKVKPQLAISYLEPDNIIESAGLLDREKMGLLPL
ncbi:hypothetical protein [Pontibacter fetidus]|uniref:Uncharacterized protein n=1 Tax=Pontibacter fetidus TaxID=2700082 RepID=A0A6B2H4R8_9BACT|nr:hypothetical protein [Pontibacter fetidus]NDK54770.1 hypothetical protein [Pontibacter fetidus]